MDPIEASITWKGDTFSASLLVSKLVYVRKNNIQVATAHWSRKKIIVSDGSLPREPLLLLTSKLRLAFLGSRIRTSFKSPDTSMLEAIKWLTLCDVPEGCIRWARVKGRQVIYSAFLMPKGELIVCRGTGIIGKGIWGDKESRIMAYIGTKIPHAVQRKLTSELSKR